MHPSRRGFIGGALGCASYLALAPAAALRTFAAGPLGEVVAEESFARIERLGEGMWAVVSTPLRDGGRHFATTANGGIVAGTKDVLVIEGFYTDEGARWVAEQARELTGRHPTHVVVTHFHADHVRGLGGLTVAEEGQTAPSAWATETTHDLMAKNDEKPLPDHFVAEAHGITSIDLGGRTARLIPRRGHTPSDVTVELDDAIWCGDLVWNGMFPNYVDAIPSHLTRHCEAILGREGTRYVPGHGDASDAAGLAPYLGLVQDVEAAARRAVEAGRPANEAAAEYSLPESLSSWVLFSDDYFERAFSAWERELTAR